MNNILKPIQPQKIGINSLHVMFDDKELKCIFYHAQQLNSLMLKESNGHIGIVAFLIRKRYNSYLDLCLMLGINTIFDIGTMWNHENLISNYKDEFIFLFENPNDYFNGFWKVAFNTANFSFNDDFNEFEGFKIKNFGGKKLKQIIENYCKTIFAKSLKNFLK